MATKPTTVFEKYESQNYPFRWDVRLHVAKLVGGIPTDAHKAEGWLKSKLALKDDLLREAVAEVMAERGLDANAAAEVVSMNRHLNGFKRTPDGQLYIEGRQLKAALKEAANVAVSVKRLNPRWGATNKGVKAFVAEHIFVVEDLLPIATAEGAPVTEPTEVVQRFVHTFRGAGIQYEEVVEDAVVNATIESDYDFKDEEWAALWLTGERQGIGATRSQGYGRYVVIAWDRIELTATKSKAKA